MRKSIFTEQFLWKLYEFLEAANTVQETFTSRPSWDQALRRGWWQLQHEYEKEGRTKTFSQFISYLRGRGYVKIPEGKNISTLQLTETGKQKALLGNPEAQKLPLRKDRKMVMVMYDIPKEGEYIRHVFRSKLESLDYQMLQKSVWVSDKDVVAKTERAIRECDLGDCVNLFVIERVQVRKV